VTRLAARSAGAIAALGQPRWTSETAFQSDVVALARECGWGLTIKAEKALAFEAEQYGVAPPALDGLIYHPRYSMGSDPGWPDLVLVRRRDRRVLFRELKTDHNSLSRRQRAVLELLTDCGLDAGVWRPRDWPEIQEALR
jgi:hypothetical protein